MWILLHLKTFWFCSTLNEQKTSPLYFVRTLHLCLWKYTEIKESRERLIYLNKLHSLLTTKDNQPCQNVPAGNNFAIFSQCLAAYSTLDFTRSPLAGKGTWCLMATAPSMPPVGPKTSQAQKNVFVKLEMCHHLVNIKWMKNAGKYFITKHMYFYPFQLFCLCFSVAFWTICAGQLAGNQKQMAVGKCTKFFICFASFPMIDCCNETFRLH